MSAVVVLVGVVSVVYVAGVGWAAWLLDRWTEPAPGKGNLRTLVIGLCSVLWIATMPTLLAGRFIPSFGEFLRSGR